ncbi:MAG: lipid-A-disaccharide synthase [Paludibacteraceae bacterium]|nr:lipid-A-disaccharide synthase [Paludibacteraceae bacterium]
MKYFIIAGEVSGDMHAARLIEDIRQKDPSAVFVGFGGDNMQQAGCRLLRHINDMAFMGVVAVLTNLHKVLHNIRIARSSLIEEKPDVLILVDYPTFNLRIARFVRKHLSETKIVYYIPPKVWAWKTWRVHEIGRLCDRILCIFPFEVEFYARYGYKAEYIGNPTLKAIKALETETDFSNLNNFKRHYIAILPGSRKHEVRKCLGKMLRAALMQEEYDVVIAAVSGVDRRVYNRIITAEKVGAQRVSIVSDNTWEVVRNASVALVNSGTATLETALLGTPQIAVYHVAAGPLLYSLRHIIFRTKWFTLVNIIAQKEVIHEWLAYRFTVSNVARDLNQLLHDTEAQQLMLQEYKEVRTKLNSEQSFL